ncbi:MAG TPA: GGDEF domain-containing protein [Candidatus Tyrphobacter sp.]
MEELFRALVAAARRSSDDVLRVLDLAARAAEPRIDAVLFFACEGDVLTCRYASGTRAEHFRALQIRPEDRALPARAALLAQTQRLSRGARGLMPGDRAALAAPMISGRRVAGVWYGASASPMHLESGERIVRLTECVCEPYVLALEREADRNDATFDSLTGVLTPRAFRRTLHQLVAASDAVISLWFVDTDRFKRINDDYGHAAGDVVLQRMAALLLGHAVPEMDIVGRKGGDEFCMLLRGRTKMRAILRAQSFCAAVRVNDFGVPARITASVGVAAYPFDARDAAALLEAADASMYHAKRSGRDRVAYAAEGSGFALYE